MTQFVDIFGFFCVLLRGLSFSFEALTLGGMIFLYAVARGIVDKEATARIRQWIRWASMLLAISRIWLVGLTSAILMGSTDMRLADLIGAGFCTSAALTVAGAAATALAATTKCFYAVCPAAAALMLAGSVMSSHSFARLQHRWLLIPSTLAHHAASAAWIGALPFLVLTLRHVTRKAAASAIAARFSRMAMFAVALLFTAGAVLGWLFTGSAGALTQTNYGIMLLGKILLTLILLPLGALNFRIVRAAGTGVARDLLPLRRFAEVEVGIGFTILLAAASLTSAPPAIDVIEDRVSLDVIAQRTVPRWPRMETPPVAALAPPTPLSPVKNALPAATFATGQTPTANGPADIAWSEYNHHWAGLVVLTIGLLALFSRRFSFARHWPLAFCGLAAFLFFRADSENWPLGPRGFWESFLVPEVAQHRTFVLLIIAFAIFEWAVQTEKLAPRLAGLVFPLVCSIGSALLITHSHSADNVKEEFLGELSHLPVAILGVVAGWSRWLEIRLPTRRPAVIPWLWPVCFALIGSILFLYREA